MLVLYMTTQALVRSDYCAEFVGSVKSNHLIIGLNLANLGGVIRNF